MDFVRPQPPVRMEDSEKLAVILMGVTGSGKSTFISLLSDQDVEVGHGLESHTTTPASYKLVDEGREIILVDTPGFDDTTRPDVEILTEMAQLLAALYNSKTRLAGIIYLHRITDPRFSGTAVKNLEILKKICGPSNFDSVAIVMNMWDTIDTNTATQRESELRDTFWAPMLNGGSTLHRHIATTDSALQILRSLVDKAQPRRVLSLQNELVVEGKTLDATAAGQYVQKEMLEAKKKHEEDIEFLKSSMADAIREKDDSLLRTLREERSAAEAKLNSAAAEHQHLGVAYDQFLAQEHRQKMSLLLFEEMDTQPSPPRLALDRMYSPLPSSSTAASQSTNASGLNHESQDYTPVSDSRGPPSTSNNYSPYPPASQPPRPQETGLPPNTGTNQQCCDHEMKLQCEQEKLQVAIHDAEQHYHTLIEIRDTPQHKKTKASGVVARQGSHGSGVIAAARGALPSWLGGGGGSGRSVRGGQQQSRSLEEDLAYPAVNTLVSRLSRRS